MGRSQKIYITDILNVSGIGKCECDMFHDRSQKVNITVGVLSLTTQRDIVLNFIGKNLFGRTIPGCNFAATPPKK
ncbi:hypothetical protein JIR001_25280 [Polycladomyces abyssicola]|uniref:Uncharacterized protein n=1 Tax=Polycladomyces abyssicola TaxID=1125966 RepID=A0A8D5UGD2_9BACL|nr:hypothetical protein JIR001_25280 [Polycladomyces abyssicola]